MRTVFSINALGGIDPGTDEERLTVHVVRSPSKVDKMEVARPLALSAVAMPAWGAPNAVRDRGRLVRDSLSSHPGVKTLLGQIYATAVGHSQPIFLMLSESEAEQISWEALCDLNDQFVALDPRWPIGRIIDPATAPPRPPAVMKLPVRMMALISAFGIKTQLKEWQMLRDCVTAAKAQGLPVSLKVMVGDPAVHHAITADIAAAGLGDVEVGPIEKLPTRLVQSILDWSPNILHCFCHGRSEPANQSIELASALDYEDTTATEGSVKVSVGQLQALSSQLQNPWLLTLNVCASGQAAKGLQSMAHQVVAAGFPAAVAMLEPVDASDAYEFTRAFYRSVFAGLARAAADLKLQSRVFFEWADSMVYARTAICEQHEGDAPNAREWVLPLLYVRGLDPLSFERPAAVPEDQANAYRTRARLVADWLKGPGQQMTEEQRHAVMSQVLNDVPQDFWPTLDGSFDKD